MAPLGHDNQAFTIDGKHGASQTWNGEAKKKRRAKWTCCQVTLLVLASLSVVMGVAMLAGGFQAIFDTILKSEMEVVEGSRAYEMWRLTPVPLFLRLYFFNITNPKEFIAGQKAILEEVGPYCYREYHEKKNMSFDGNTVTYLQQRWWVWDQEASGNNSLDDPIVNLNTIPISAAWSVRHNPLALSGLNDFLKKKKEPLIHISTARELIFEGYEDPVLDWMQSINIPPWLVDLPPGLTDYDRFAWFYKRNMSLTYDGEFTMYNGHDTLDNLGNIESWNGENETTFFTSPCNHVKGSAGELWPRNQEKDMIAFYSSDLCMSMSLFYDREMEDENGVSGYRYSANNKTFANETVVPGNECYCVEETCAPTGLLNAESCRMGSPAFISFPHFLHADPFLLDSVEGLSPNMSDHQFYIDLIPELGIPISVAARMQINMHVIPYPGEGLFNAGKIDMLSDVTEVYLPLLWFETIASLPHKDAKELKMLLFVMRSPIMTIIFSLLVALGLLTIILVLIYHKFARRN